MPILINVNIKNFLLKQAEFWHKNVVKARKQGGAAVSNGKYRLKKINFY
jgi:hypothetical protein